MSDYDAQKKLRELRDGAPNEMIAALTGTAPRFQMTYCSQCSAELGPGDEGTSHCSDHASRLSDDQISAAFQEAFPGHDLHQESIDFARAVERKVMGAERPPCAICGVPYAKHGTYPTCAAHRYQAVAELSKDKRHDYPACAIFRGGKCTCD